MDGAAEAGGPARVSVTVMAHPSRRSWALDLAKKLDCEVVWDRRNNVWDTASRAWASHDPDTTHHAVIQDDALIAHRLFDVLPEIVACRPRSLISLLTIEAKLSKQNLPRYESAVDDGSGWFWAYDGLPGCALVMPVADILPMLLQGDRMSTPHDDQKIMSYFRSRQRPAWFVIPSLAQHRNQDENPSLVNPNLGWRPRQSGRFVGVDFDATQLEFSGDGLPAEADYVPVAPKAYRNAATGRVVVVDDPAEQSQMASARRWLETDLPTLARWSEALR